MSTKTIGTIRGVTVELTVEPTQLDQREAAELDAARDADKERQVALREDYLKAVPLV